MDTETNNLEQIEQAQSRVEDADLQTACSARNLLIHGVTPTALEMLRNHAAESFRARQAYSDALGIQSQHWADEAAKMEALKL